MEPATIQFAESLLTRPPVSAPQRKQRRHLAEAGYEMRGAGNPQSTRI